MISHERYHGTTVIPLVSFEWWFSIYKKISKKVNIGDSLFTLSLAALLVFFGSCNALLFKSQDECYSKGYFNEPPVSFEHPFTQTFWQFVGMFLMPIPFIAYNKVTTLYTKYESSKKLNLQLKRDSLRAKSEEKISKNENDGEKEEKGEEKKEKKLEKKKEEKQKPQLNTVFVSLSSLADIFGTAFRFWGLVFTYASVVEMLSNSVIIFSAILSFFILKRRLYPHNIVGIIIVFLGTAMLTISSLTEEATQHARNPFVGAVFCVFGALCYSLYNLVDEGLLTKFSINPVEYCFWCGYWGVVLSVLILFITYFIPGGDGGALENMPLSFAQLSSNWLLLVLVICGVISKGMSNICGIAITQRLGAVGRMTIRSMRVITVWVVQIIRGQDTFDWFRFSGFVVIIVGASYYNQVVDFPWYTVWFKMQLKEKGKYFGCIIPPIVRKLKKKKKDQKKYDTFNSSDEKK